MKAAQLTSYDGPQAVVINEIDQPSIAPSQVLVKVHAAGVSPFDWKITMGYAKNWVDLQFPATIGGDLAGVIAQVGADVAGFAVGEAVYGSGNTLSGNGSFAEFAPADASKLAPMPATIDAVTAAAYPLAACSAYQAIVLTAQVQPGQKVLIHGGAGGIGSLAIQLARQAGAHVATTAGPDDLDYVRGLGADEAFNYKDDDFTTLAQNYDLVFDTVGGDTNKKSYSVLKAGGQLLSLVEQPNEALAKQYGVTAQFLSIGVTTETLKEITQLIDSGKLTLNIDKQFPLNQTADALAYLKDQHVRGKVVITVL